MSIDEALQCAQDALERAFEDWLASETPSGDRESVQRQWDESFAHRELIDELQPVMALTAEVRRLQTELEQERKRLDWAIEHWSRGVSYLFSWDDESDIREYQETTDHRAVIDELMERTT